MTVTTLTVTSFVTTRPIGNRSGVAMLPADFDPFFAAWGIKRRDFTQPQPQKVTR